MALNNKAYGPEGRPRAIIFDWDNTLVDSWPVIRDALNTTLTTFGHAPWSMAEVRVRVRKSVRDTFPTLFGDGWKDAADVFYTRYGAIHSEMIKPIPGISEMLQEISELGIYQAIVSNKRGDYLRQEADHLDWSRYFGQIVGANDAKKDKPAPDPVRLALKDRNDLQDTVSPSDIWFVGDADIDMECANNASCTPILLRADPAKDDEFAVHSPIWHFEDGQALCKRLRNL